METNKQKFARVYAESFKRPICILALKTVFSQKTENNMPAAQPENM